MNPLMPLVVMSGPNYVADYTASVTRVGNTGQLGDLFDPEAFTSPDLDELEDLWVQEAHAMRAARGRYASDYSREDTHCRALTSRDSKSSPLDRARPRARRRICI